MVVLENMICLVFGKFLDIMPSLYGEFSSKSVLMSMSNSNGVLLSSYILSGGLGVGLCTGSG